MKKYYNYSLSVLASLVLIIAIGITGAIAEPMEGSMPVYYLGSSEGVLEMHEKFADVTYIDEIEMAALPREARHILVINNSNRNNRNRKSRQFISKKFLHKEMKAGNIVVTVGNRKAAKETLEGLIGKGFSIEPVTAISPDGINQTVTTSAYYYTNNGIAITYATIEKDPVSALELAVKWANDISMEMEQAEVVDAGNFERSGGGSFDMFYQRNFSTGNGWQPYGIVNIRNQYYWLENDNSSEYDWYSIKFKVQSVPGYHVYASNWRTHEIAASVDADYYNSDYFLSEYAPTGSVGDTTIGVDIGVTAGYKEASVSASVGWSYTTSDVFITDYGNYNQESAYWMHDVNENKNVGKYTYEIKPGACIRIPQGDSDSWYEYYKIKYRKGQGGLLGNAWGHLWF